MKIIALSAIPSENITRFLLYIPISPLYTFGPQNLMKQKFATLACIKNPRLMINHHLMQADLPMNGNRA